MVPSVVTEAPQFQRSSELIGAGHWHWLAPVIAGAIYSPDAQHVRFGIYRQAR